MRHQPLPVSAQRNHRQFKIDPPGILRRQLMNFGHVDEADRKELNVLIGVFQKILHPFHGFRVEEQIRPFHVFVPAQAPELHGVGRLGVDVVEDKFPIILRGFRRVVGFTIRMIEFITEGAFYGTLFPQTQGDFARVHFARQHLPIPFALQHQRGL